jgi:hypothetical protein
MPTTYLLLRNNKETGPHSLDDLLRLNLKPQDLIWEEGRSAGWRYPTEIDSLKPFLAQQAAPTPPDPQPDHTTNHTAHQPPEAPTKTPATQNNHSHIYVSLPVGRPPVEETPAEPTLEAKAEALYERVQAFAKGQPAAETDTHYARSLDDMKQEYGTWLVQQKKKKKYGSTRKKLAIAASVLVITTTSFGISKWISHKTNSSTDPVSTYSLGTMSEGMEQEPATVSLKTAPDTFTLKTEIPTLNNSLIKDTGTAKTTTRSAVPKKKTASKKIRVPNVLPDSSNNTAPPVAEVKEPATSEIKKTVALSQLVSVNGTMQYDKKGTAILATDVVLQNKSAETLKSVAVTVTYYKKENRALPPETIYYYNVQPNSAPVIHVTPGRKATSVRFEIGAITRADGSLYFIR